MVNDRRGCRRLPAWLPAALPGNGVRLGGHVCDISRSGCFVETHGPGFPSGNSPLSVRAPTGMWVQLPGYVVRLSPGEGFAYEFERLSETESMVVGYLIDYLDSRDGAG